MNESTVLSHAARLALLIAVSLPLAPGIPALACMNGTERVSTDYQPYPTLNEVIKPDELKRLLSPPPISQAYWKSRVAEFEQQRLPQGTAADRNDYALALAYAGEYAQAKAVWQQLEVDSPGLYATAANLGTAFELAGDNASALKWIKEGVRRDPGSHAGSEWLHVKILEAKLQLERDPRWLEQHTVLGLDFGPGPQPVKPAALGTGNTDQPLTLDELTGGLAYQLKERLKFIREPEPVVASLLTDLGNVLLLSQSPRSAEIAFDRALAYGAKGALFSKRLAFAEQRAQSATANRYHYQPHARRAPDRGLQLGLALGTIVVGGGLLVYLRARRLRRSTWT